MSTSSTRRRLARDHAELQKSLPPDFFFPTPLTLSTYSLPGDSDLTTLTLHLLGPTSTPFASGLFTLTLTLPATYPNSPPKATFRTKIFHPNVDDRTGDVCVDTLKRDWKPELTIRHVLLTIRCLLIFPNPESSLNESAGKLLRENYKSFERHAKLMSEVHAMIPKALRELVEEVRARDEDVSTEKKVEGKGKRRESAVEEETVVEAGKENDATLTLTTTPSTTALNTTISPPATANNNVIVASAPTLPHPPTPASPTTPSSLGKRIMSESHENLPSALSGGDRQKQPKLNNTAIHNLSPNASSSSLPMNSHAPGKETEGNPVGNKPLEVLKRPVVKRVMSAAERKSAQVKKGLKRY